jgi:hypothetical protein
MATRNTVRLSLPAVNVGRVAGYCHETFRAGVCAENTKVACTINCTISEIKVSSVAECEARCNSTTTCRAITITHASKYSNSRLAAVDASRHSPLKHAHSTCWCADGSDRRSCELLTYISPGTSDPARDTYVRVPDPFYGRHRVFYDNPQSIRAKVQMAKSFGVRGFSAWTANMLPYSSKPTDATAMWLALSS